MKKSILSIAIAAISLFTVSASAQTTNDKTTDKKEMARSFNRPNPFEGLNLTAEQQAQLKAIGEKMRPSKEDMKAAKEAKKEAKKENRKKMMEERKAKRSEYLAQVKKVLSADQYIKFLENSYVNNAPNFNRPGREGMGNKQQNGQRPNAPRHNKK